MNENRQKPCDRCGAYKPGPRRFINLTVLLEGTSYAFYKNGQAVCADCFDELMKSFSDASRAIENGIRCGNLPEV